MGKASKEKGADFERLVCRMLSRWILPDEPDTTLFWRSAMSGGRATVRRQAGKVDNTQTSDLTCIDSRGYPLTHIFTIECKHYKNLNIGSGVVHGKQDLALFWRQVSRDAAHAAKRPLLIARQNSWPILVLVRSQDYPTFFGPVSGLERARLFKLSTRAASVSMFTLEDLLSVPYQQRRFNVQKPSA